ncbi:MAG: carboxypeptidase regulatory-like domain-containing protein [Candidatus Peregrinibacteria bacterium]|nr:carboxypeptidase regulatory-like domain-containing protein [Candidatus Peregrinibacteria bacterium]MDZ4244923.1 carboxypeptidase regulatory-like domain-containing protein [Candidatus Gracilibacteria bacterium]
MGKIVNSLFFRKVTSVIGIFAIINSMIVAVPTAYAVPEAVDPATANYIAIDPDIGGGDRSTITVGFTEPLTDANSILCGQGFPPTNCYDPEGVTLDGGVWKNGATASSVFQSPSDATQLIVIFSTNNVIEGEGSTIKFNNFGGIESEQTFIPNYVAPDVETSISAVNLVDQDTTVFGLGGDDFFTSWTNASQSAPTGFTQNRVYVVPDATDLTAANVDTVGCGGSSCDAHMFFNSWSFTSGTLSSFYSADSAGGEWDEATPYKACIVTTATTSEIKCSSASSVTSDDVEDDDAPFVDHFPVHTAIKDGSNDVNIYASINDAHTPLSAFNNIGDGGYFKLKYFSEGNWDSSLNGVQVNGSLFKFTVPFDSIPAVDSTFSYYLVAADTDGNADVICGDFSASTEAECQSAPFVANVISGDTTVTVSGTVKDFNDNNIEDATVIPGGLAAPSAVATTDVDGTYIISGVPAQNAYDFAAFKLGYCESVRFEIVGASDKTGVDMFINDNACVNNSDPGQGGSDRPFVMETIPWPGQFNVSPSTNITVFMSKDMGSTTINDSDPTDADDNIYLTPDDGTTKIAGTVIYCANSEALGQACAEAIEENQTDAIVFNPTSSLTAGMYTLVLKQGVLDNAGRSIDGSRSDGGHELNFSVGSGVFDAEAMTNFGQSGAYMPPYVESITPPPGIMSPTNTKFVIKFNDALDPATVTSNSVQFLNSNNEAVTATRSVSSDGRRVTLSPSTALSAGEYSVIVKGSVSTVNGITMLDPANVASTAFEAPITVGSNADSTAPTVYASIADGGIIPVNEPLRFGFSEFMAEGTLTSSSGGITLKRGNTNISFTTAYDPASSELVVQPTYVLPPSTAVTVTFVNPTVTDLQGNVMASTIYNYTTGAVDSVSPATNGNSGCDDYKCRISFTETMRHGAQTDSNYSSSVLKPANFNLVVGDTIDLAAEGVTFTYQDGGVDINGLNLFGRIGDSFTMTVTGVQDLSGNSIATANDQNKVYGTIQNSSNTFGSFGGDHVAMFGPPTAGGGGVGTAFNAGASDQMGGFSFADVFGGSATMVFPSNPMAGIDADVMQIRFSPEAVLQDADQIVITFPTTTVVTAAKPDAWSPYKLDFNEQWGEGTITFDNDFDTDGVSNDSQRKVVTVQLDITGTPDANDSYTIDLKGIVNPTIPKGPSTSGYTANVKVLRGNTEISNSTSMPYYIEQAGDNTLTVNVYAGNQGAPDNVAGDVFIHGWGPTGSMSREVTLASGIISQVNNVNASTVSYASLPDGCYNIGTEPFVTLGGTDYFGEGFAEPICLEGGETVNHDIILANAANTAGATLTVKLAGIDFEGEDVEIFAVGPGRSVVKSLMALDAADPDGYTLKLPANGNWFIGVGPSMPKGSMGAPKALPGVSPSNMEIRVSNIDSTPVIKQGFQPGPGVTFDDVTDTVTFTFAAADKTVSGTIKDGDNNAISGVDVGLHSQGFGMGVFTQTANDGTFSLSVSELGSYELEAHKWGLPSVNKHIEIRAGNPPTIHFKGKQITGGNPLVIKMKKADYSISGKVLDASGSAISWSPVRATDENGSAVYGGTDESGNYMLFVGAGTWTVKAELPPDKSEECGTYSKTVTVTNESKSSQNLEPSATTCYTLSGTVTIAGSAMANGSVMIEEWDTVNSRPAGGVFRPTTTNSSGVYSAKVSGSKTYRVSTWDPTYGEVSSTVAIMSANATKNLTSASAANNTFSFTGLDEAKLENLEGFIELENTSTGERKFENIKDFSESKIVKGLGDEFNYRLNIYGVGDYTGTVSANAIEVIDFSATITDIITYSGTITDDNGDPIPNAAVTLDSTISSVVRTAVTDANGDYSVDVRDGTYQVSASLANHLPSARVSVTLNADSADNDISLIKADATIEGTIYKWDGSTPADSGFVTATNTSTGAKITVPIDGTDGSYSVPVSDGDWSIIAGGVVAHDKKTGDTIAVAGADDIGNNITLTANANKTNSSAVKSVAANAGGTVDDTANTGVRVTTGGRVLTTGNSNVNITIEKNYEAGDTSNNLTLGNVGFELTAVDSSQSYSDFSGNVNLQISYADLLTDLPAGASESDLKLAYYSTEKGEYIPVEGGYTVDTANNVVTANTNHFTTFALVVPASSVSSSSSGVSGSSSSRRATSEVALIDGEEVVVEECVTSAVEAAEDESAAEAAAAECLPADDSDIATVEEEKSYTEVDEEAGTVTYLVPPSDTYEVTFTDMVNHWSEEIISDLAGRGIVDGYVIDNHTEFKPDKGMTRAELVKAIVRAMELPIPLDFTAVDLGYYDVRSDSLYAPYIYAAQKAGIVDRAATFRPNAIVNRAEALKIILIGAKVDLMDYPDGMLLPFGDVMRDAWFRNNLKYAFFHGIIGGYDVDGKKEFRGANTVTRAEASKMISKVFSFEDEISLGDMLKASFFRMFR